MPSWSTTGGLRGGRGVEAEEPASASIVVTPGVSTSTGRVEPLGNTGARNATRDLEVGGVVAVLAGDERVLARARRREEVDRLAPAHHPGLRLDRVVLEPAALEDPVVGALVQAEAPLQALLVAVERVRVLHDELPHADEGRRGARLVADLRLEVVEDLRELPVRAELAGVEGDRLLVGHREHEGPAHAVLGLPQLGIG